MATQLYTPGPTYLQLGTGAAGALEHLGWSERGVRITLDGAFEDVMTDVSGTRIPFDVLAMAEQAFITVDLNLYDEAILNKALGARTGNAALPGTMGPTTVGSLIRLEAFMYRILVYNPYETKAAMAAMNDAYNFPTGYLDAAVEIELSSRVKVQRCIFRAIPGWNQVSGGGVLYNFSKIGLVGVT